VIGPGGPVVVGDPARDLGDAVLHPPLAPVVPALGWLPSAAYAWTLWPAIGLLPPTIRAGYGFRWGPMEQIVSAWLVAAWRSWRRVLPASFRQMPQALAADARIAAERDVEEP
jgi:uncharacterized protein (DUF2236 family)